MSVKVSPRQAWRNGTMAPECVRALGQAAELIATAVEEIRSSPTITARQDEALTVAGDLLVGAVLACVASIIEDKRAALDVVRKVLEPTGA